MNHNFIETLIKLYEELPESNPSLAASRVAVLIDMELEKLERAGIPLSRENLIKSIQESIDEHSRKVA